LAYIYMITNTVNGKRYIGQTKFSVADRWLGHLSDAKKENRQHRALYKAINKYGEKAFDISVVEECATEQLNDREIFWINYYATHTNGYNETRGGCGKLYYDYSQILSLIKEKLSTNDIVASIGCSRELVCKVARENGIDRQEFIGVNFCETAKPVLMININTNNKKVFNSIADAARVVSKERDIKLHSGIRTHISECCRGKRKIAYGYAWAYI